ncbi:MAG: carboxypeptidase M32 [bacterium]
MTEMEKLKEKLLEISHLSAAAALLSWDQETFMPKGSAGFRAATLSTLSGLIHSRVTALELVELIQRLTEAKAAGSLTEEEGHIVREIKRDVDRATKLPVEFVKEFSEATSLSIEVWQNARAKSNFSLFEPSLQKIVDLNKRYAEYMGYEDSPYNALLDGYEPNMTVAQLDEVFLDLKNFLVPFLAEVVATKTFTPEQKILGDFSEEGQKKFCEAIVERMGYDLATGRTDVSTHPFTIGMHPRDVRITTRYDLANIFPAVFAAIHEAGHAIYEQGLLEKHYGTPLGESVSHGLHESQSRLWENIVGRGRPFWEYFYPGLQEIFPKPFKELPLPDFLGAVNSVGPSLIRVEADEVSYNLHIILRYEIEKGLMDGGLEVKDLPEIWRAKTKEYLGLEVEKDSDGVLQDVHWAHGSFGYFPTYTLGNIWSAQIYAAAKELNPGLEEDYKKGEFGRLKGWLNREIHAHGRAYSASEIIKRATGQEASATAYKDYLRTKYLA